MDAAPELGLVADDFHAVQHHGTHRGWTDVQTAALCGQAVCKFDTGQGDIGRVVDHRGAAFMKGGEDRRGIGNVVIRAQAAGDHDEAA